MILWKDFTRSVYNLNRWIDELFFHILNLTGVSFDFTSDKNTQEFFLLTFSSFFSEENTKVIEIERKMPLSFGKRSAYKQFQNTSIISHQKNTAQTPSAQSSHLKSVEIVKSPPGCSFFTARKTAPQRQQEFIKAINVLYGSERRVRNSPLSGK